MNFPSPIHLKTLPVFGRLRLKSLFRWSPEEHRLRLCRFLWFRGSGPGHPGSSNYSAALSLALEVKLELWLGAFWKRQENGWTAWLCLLPCLPFRLHYQRSRGGWIC